MTSGRRPTAPAPDPPPPTVDDASASSGEPFGGGPRLADISRLANLFGKVVAPATLVTGLLFYFGWSFTYWFFHYFGVNSTLLGSTTQDYLMRSVDPLFVPLTVLAAAGLVVLWARALIPRRVSAAVRTRWMRRRALVTAVAGTMLVAVAVAAIVNPTVQDNTFLLAPLALTFGVPMLAYAVHHARDSQVQSSRITPELEWRRLAEWAAVFALVALGLFWAVSEYAAAVGRTRAMQFERTLHREPYAVLYSERDLSLSGPGITEVRCSAEGAAYEFRYDGLVLVLDTGGQYVLLPRVWTPRQPTPAFVIPESDSLRLEFMWTPGASERPRC